MALGTELQETVEKFAESLSPEQITKAHHKSLELDKFLGFTDNLEIQIIQKMTSPLFFQQNQIPCPLMNFLM